MASRSIRIGEIEQPHSRLCYLIWWSRLTARHSIGHKVNQSPSNPDRVHQQRSSIMKKFTITTATVGVLAATALGLAGVAVRPLAPSRGQPPTPSRRRKPKATTRNSTGLRPLIRLIRPARRTHPGLEQTRWWRRVPIPTSRSTPATTWLSKHSTRECAQERGCPAHPAISVGTRDIVLLRCQRGIRLDCCSKHIPSYHRSPGRHVLRRDAQPKQEL
jgi:hypothetical protein